MPYFSIAYLTESDRCVCILSQADSLKAASDAFQARNPNTQIVSVWERPDFVPVPHSAAPASASDADRIATLEKRVAALEEKLQNGHVAETVMSDIADKVGSATQKQLQNLSEEEWFERIKPLYDRLKASDSKVLKDFLEKHGIPATVTLDDTRNTKQCAQSAPDGPPQARAERLMNDVRVAAESELGNALKQLGMLRQPTDDCGYDMYRAAVLASLPLAINGLLGRIQMVLHEIGYF